MASQKFTWPKVIGVDPALTVAVSVTIVPAGTDVTAAVPDVTLSVVEVEPAVELIEYCPMAIADCPYPDAVAMALRLVSFVMEIGPE
jgi:hypothetical protein